MKFAIPLQQFRKCIILFSLGIIGATLSYMLHIINPVKTILYNNLQMSPNSMVFKVWQKPQIDVYVRVYIFNVTNAEAFLNGEEKLKLEEIGPYVYKEVLENTNITWHENKTISYMPKRTIHYVPEMSIADPKEHVINVPNVPMLGLSSALHDAGFFINFPFSRLVNMLDSKPILNITVYDYLWGYDDALVQLATAIVPNILNFRKLGLLDRMYDEGDNIVSMNIGQNENMTNEEGRYLSIETYNDSPGMYQWGYRDPEGNETCPQNTICNSVKGSTEGVLFPMNLDKHAIFRVYRKSFCRTIPITFKEEVVEKGLTGYRYTLADDFLDRPDQNPDNECYCRKLKKCLKKGLSDLTPCYYNIPAAISLPHFLDADPSIYENIEGVHPDPEKHRSKIILQPTIGIPMSVNSRVQVNLIMHHTSYNHRIAPFNDLTIPLLWTDLHIPSLPSDLEILLKLVLNVLPIVQAIVIYLLGIAGVMMLVLSIPALLWTINQQREPFTPQRRDSSDLKIPLNYGQYTTIHILPAIKKITSKTDLFS